MYYNHCFVMIYFAFRHVIVIVTATARTTLYRRVLSPWPPASAKALRTSHTAGGWTIVVRWHRDIQTNPPHHSLSDSHDRRLKVHK